MNVFATLFMISNTIGFMVTLKGMSCEWAQLIMTTIIPMHAILSIISNYISIVFNTNPELRECNNAIVSSDADCSERKTYFHVCTHVKNAAVVTY